MNKKALTDVVWMIILGFLIFTLVSCSLGEGLTKAFNSYKNSEKSLQTLIDVSKNMSEPSSNVKLTLVNLKMEEGTAVYVFTSQDDLIENKFFVVQGDPKEHLEKRVIKKPDECANIINCICLCKDTALKNPKEEVADELKKKYNVDYVSEITCGNGIECYSLDNDLGDKIFQETTELEKIVTDTDFKRVQYTVPRIWEGGFSFSRNKDNGEQLIRTPYTDIYVIKNIDGTIGFCFDADKCAPML
jgi:hypothetical protein